MADLTGQRLGQYLVLERISKGATSTVYKAYQEKLERYVAVKVLSPHFVDEEGFLERFKQEARAVAQLDHPNIVPVYDFDQVGDTIYIVMKYVDTGTLKELVGGPLDLRITLEIFTQVGLALGYAHRQGVIHRDVKPGNVLLGEGNWALLTDFGLAKMRAGDRKLTKSGIGMGTPDYMAPEQAQGLPVDGRVDLYSLGCALHEMLTGKVPFEADSGMAVIVKHITEPPRPPREINPELPLAVEQVILRSLEKDPNKRYQTAEAMVADLARAVGRPDQFVLPEALSAHPQGTSRSIAPTATPKTLPAGPTRFDRTREWLRDKRPVVAAGARGAGNWFAVKLQRIGHAIRIDFERFARWARRMMIALWTALKRGFNRARLAIVGLMASIKAAAAPKTQPPPTKSAPARSRSKTAKSKSTASKKAALGSRAKEPPTAQSTVRLVVDRVQASVDAVRRSATRRRIAAACAALLLIVLLVAFALRPSSSEARVEATSTSIAAIDPTPAATTVLDPTPTEPTGTPVPPTDTPQPEATATALPETPPGMVAVTGGTFRMGASAGAFEADETPPHSVTVSPFYIDAVEVTIAQYARFADGSGYATDAEKKGDATTWRVANTPDRQRYPVTRVSWNDADIFCRWYGKRLPTEAEWELAAKGYTQNIYTWGNTFSSDRINTAERGVGQPVGVASSPSNASPFGAYDVLGNVWEWVADWYDGGYYARSPATNPKGPASGLERVIRGGSFKSDGTRATTTIRRKASQDGWSDDLGFRCVKDIP